jgi:hypothetical protein
MPFGWFEKKAPQKQAPEPRTMSVQQLRLRRKELALLKKSLIEQQRQIRAAYTEQIRKPSFSVRIMMSKGQTQVHKRQRRTLATQLKPLEQQRQAVEAELAQIELALLRLQAK